MTLKLLDNITPRLDASHFTFVNAALPIPSCIPIWDWDVTALLETAFAGRAVDSRLSIRDCHAVTMASAHETFDDSALVLAACSGDRSAFGGLYAKYARMVHGILLARVPPGDVDDLVHDVFLRALPRLASLRDASRFGPWLSTIARNIANDYFRRTKPVSTVTESLSDDEAQEPAAHKTENPSDSEAAMILEIVRTLSETYRETLILRLVEGMTGPEIAARTGLKPGSVRVNLHRGMQQLREKLAAATTKGMPAKQAGAEPASLRKEHLPRRSAP